MTIRVETEIRINDDAFKGLVQFNGQLAKPDRDKKKDLIFGADGRQRFVLKSQTSVYLAPDQYLVL